jgi:hypothetical protein
MTDKPINLRQARKAREKAENRAEADANAALHGRPKWQRRAEDENKRRDTAQLDGKKLDK